MKKSKKKNKSNFLIISISIGVFAVAAAMVFLYFHPEVLAGDEGVIAHPTVDFKDGRARHFEYKTGDGVIVRYFIVKDSGDRIRAAFDACESCWRAGLGYVQQGGVMVCRNCGLRFPLEKVGAVRGGCNPHPLKFEVKGDQILVRAGDLAKDASYFDL